MKKFTMFACLALALVFALSSFADELPRMTKGNSTLHGGSASFAKAGGDTINLMSASDDPTNSVGEPFYVGDFENGEFAAEWTSVDITQPTVSHYQVSGFNGGTIADLHAWCGDINIPSCDDSLDPAGGYGNNWSDILEFVAPVLDPATSATVTVEADLQNDTEPGYDFTYLSYQYNNQVLANITSWDGAGTIAVNGNVTYLPIEFIGGTDVRIMFRFKSDGGWSDEDCSWPTAGAHQIDDITVTIAQAGQTDQVFTEDFDGGDGNLGDGAGDNGSYLWRIAFPDGVGDYAQIWEGLEDADPCNTNYSKQVAFIDDGLIVGGTGGTDCINWCYGPAGFIVNTTGGLAGPAEHINNSIESPVMTWPNASYDGIIFSFGAYRHEDLSNDAPGIFYTWGVRSADTDDSAGNGAQVIEDQPYLDRNFVYYGGPDYIRGGDDVTDLMNPGRDEVQVQTAVYELGWVWGWVGNDGYPAPYFDNFKVQVFPYVGPGIATREIDLANDGFPERGSIDPLDLGSHHVRFDMARNISLATHLNVDFGDSITVDIVPVRTGASLFGAPTINYTMDANPVFDPFRTAPTSGSLPGTPAIGASGIPDPDAWAFDLPDTGLLFPGDVLHYYIEAFDAIGGADIQTATLPADISEFGDFSSPLSYNSTHTIHALPTINENLGVYSAPPIIFWNDFANRGGENEWYTALNNAGKVRGVDYDVYYTNGPSSGVGNGLGGRAGSALNLELYSDMLYTSGDLGVNTISNGDFNNDSGDDVGVLTTWLLSGGKDAFMTGDDLVSDLAVNGGTSTLAFAEDWMGVSFQQQNVSSFIDNQATPVVAASAGNPVFQNISSWIAFGGCPAINTFDGVNISGGASRLAEFTDPAGLTGAYTFSAATLNIPATPGTSRVVSLPYDFMYVYTDDGAPVPPLSARSQMLRDVLFYFGLPVDPQTVTGTPELQKFAARNYPNPFNPSTKIFYTMPKAGHLSLKVYNVRGELVKTLINDQVAAGENFVTWDGTSNQGSNVSSGVYFYEARSGSDVVVNKMALVK